MCAVVVEEGRGRWAHVCRSGSREGADGRIWVAVLDESRGFLTTLGIPSSASYLSSISMQFASPTPLSIYVVASKKYPRAFILLITYGTSPSLSTTITTN